MSGKRDEDEKLGPEPFEGLLEGGVPTVNLASLDSGDKASQRQLRDALQAVEYWEVPKDARVLTGPYWGASECKIRTTTQKGFYSEESVREYYGRANTVYRVQVDGALGFWKVWLGDKQ